MTISRKFLTLPKQIRYTIHTENKPQNRPATIGEKIIPVRTSTHRHSTLQQLHQATPHNSPAHEQNQLGSGKLRYPIYIETAYPNKPQIHTTVYQLIGGLRSGMGYLGAASLEELFQKARMVEISAAGLRESHVHDFIITKDAPNYRVEN